MPPLTTRTRRVPLVFLLLTLYVASGLIVSTSSLTYAAQDLDADPVVVQTPSVILEAGTAGNPTIHANSTGAATTVHAPATTYYPSGYTLIAGTWTSGLLPASVQATDTDYFTVANAALSYQLHPTGFYDAKTKWVNETDGWDGDNATRAVETGGNVLNGIYWQSWNNSGVGTVLRVDLRVRLDLTGLVDDYVTVEWWVGGVQGSAPGSVVINSTTQGTDLLVAFDDCQEPNDGAWSWADVGNLELRLEGAKVGGADAVSYAVDEVWGWAQPASYQLDLEVQWTAAPYQETHEYLSISCGSLGTENLTVEAWWNSTWQPLLTDLSTGWNNVSVASYLTNATFTIRFSGGNETADAVSDTWQLDAVLLRVWSDEYTGDVEFTGTSNTYHWQQLNWTVDSAWTTDAVQVTLQLYNYTAGSYPTSGPGYVNYTSGPADADQLQLQALLTDVAAFRNATGGWQLRITGVKTTASPFDLKADVAEFTPVHHSEYTASTEFSFSNMISRTPIQLNVTVVGHYNVSSVNATLQLWNYSAAAYATSGEGYTTYISDGANVTTTLSVNANPEDFVSGGSAKVRVRGVLATTETYRQETNQVKLQYRYNVNTYAPVLTVTNQVAEAWKIRLSAYDQLNIDRLTNCTITLRNGGSSLQIQIVDGAYTQQQGAWIDLSGDSSIDIDVRVEATVVDTSIIHVRLDLLVPTTSVYNQFIITFQIT